MLDKTRYLPTKTAVSIILTVLVAWVIITVIQAFTGYEGEIWRGAVGLFFISWGLIQLLSRPQS